jgi:hypothetical protein
MSLSYESHRKREANEEVKSRLSSKHFYEQIHRSLRPMVSLQPERTGSARSIRDIWGHGGNNLKTVAGDLDSHLSKAIPCDNHGQHFQITTSSIRL